MHMSIQSHNSIRKTHQQHTGPIDHAVYIVQGSLLHDFIQQQDLSLWRSLGFEYYTLAPGLYSMLLLLV